MKRGVDSRQVALIALPPESQHSVNFDLHHVVDEKPCECISPHCQSIFPSQRRHAPSIDRGEGSDDLGGLGGCDQTPIGPWAFPESSCASSNVNREMTSDQQLEKHETLNQRSGQVKVHLRDPEQAECRNNS